ncbi:hypothetical protein SO802_026188, partial [Lithocarpus litseifolius]
DKNKESHGKQKEIARSRPRSFSQTADIMVRNALDLQHYHMLSCRYIQLARMKEILNEEGTPLKGKHGGGILWSKDDTFAQMTGSERCGRVRGVGFGPTSSGRSGSNLSQYTLTPPSSSETIQRIAKLETSLASVREQLAQSNARHQKQLAQSLAQLDARTAYHSKWEGAFHQKQDFNVVVEDVYKIGTLMELVRVLALSFANDGKQVKVEYCRQVDDFVHRILFLFFRFWGSMVGSSEVRTLFPSISFLFARLGASLGISCAFCPLVGGFMFGVSGLGLVLADLLPLLLESVNWFKGVVGESRAMSKVISCELETRLSTSDNLVKREGDTTASGLREVRAFHALGEACGLDTETLSKFRDRFQFPERVKVRLPQKEERACHFSPREVCFYEATFQCGLRFPIHPFVMELLSHFNIAPGQLMPNS